MQVDHIIKATVVCSRQRGLQVIDHVFTVNPQTENPQIKNRDRCPQVSGQIPRDLGIPSFTFKKLLDHLQDASSTSTARVRQQDQNDVTCTPCLRPSLHRCTGPATTLWR